MGSILCLYETQGLIVIYAPVIEMTGYLCCIAIYTNMAMCEMGEMDIECSLR